MEGYSSQEVAKLLGISRGTLRYYEKMGLAEARRDPNNGYRHFTVEDILNLQQGLWFRRMGSTTDEAVMMVRNKERLDEAHMEVYRKRLQEQMRLDQAILEQIQFYLEGLRQDFGKAEQVPMPVYCKAPEKVEMLDPRIRNFPFGGILYSFQECFWEGEFTFTKSYYFRQEHIASIFPEGLPSDWEVCGGGEAMRVKLHIRNGKLIPEEVHDFQEAFEQAGCRISGLPVSLYNFFGKAMPEAIEILVPVEKI